MPATIVLIHGLSMTPLAVYERYHVPGAGRVFFEGAIANFDRRSPLRVDFDRQEGWEDVSDAALEWATGRAA